MRISKRLIGGKPWEIKADFKTKLSRIYYQFSFANILMSLLLYVSTKIHASVIMFLWSRCDFMNELAFAVARVAT